MALSVVLGESMSSTKQLAPLSLRAEPPLPSTILLINYLCDANRAHQDRLARIPLGIWITEVRIGDQRCSII